MTELKPMTTSEVLNMLVPVSYVELMIHCPIAMKQLELDCCIISAFVASSRCPEDEDPQLYAETERELKAALKNVRQNLTSADLASAYIGMVDRFVDFVDEIQPGLSGQLESKLLTV